MVSRSHKEFQREDQKEEETKNWDMKGASKEMNKIPRIRQLENSCEFFFAKFFVGFLTLNYFYVPTQFVCQLHFPVLSEAQIA